jgi:hypothetical protein
MRLVVSFVALAAGAAAGCSTVKPWERELLAQHGMQLQATPEARAEQHMLESREASAGGFGSGGGGCGCN